MNAIRMKESTPLKGRLLAVSPDGKKQVVINEGNSGMSVYITNGTGVSLYKYLLHFNNSFQSLALAAVIHADNATLVAINAGGWVEFWTLGDPDSERGIEFKVENVEAPVAMALNADKTLVALVDKDGTVVVVAASDGYEVKRFTRLVDNPSGTWFAGNVLYASSPTVVKQIVIS